MTDHYEAILRAWNHPGYQPAYHRAMQEELRTRWPMLARALDHASVDDAVKMANGDKPWSRTYHGPNAAGVYTSDDGLTITQEQAESLIAPLGMSKPINEGFDYSNTGPEDFQVTRGPGINGSLDYNDVPPVSEGNIRRSPEGKD